MNVEYRPYRAKSMINELKHVDDWLWVNYTLNPYQGYAHLCIYCDARDDRYGLSGDFDYTVYYKGGAVDVLESQLPKLRRGIVSTGGVCDAYQPVEAKLRITRRVLQSLARHGFPVEIGTKSDLVLRDLDILWDIDAAAWAGVLFTITTFDEEVANRFEPHSPPPERRLEALGRVTRSGLTTGVMLCPILPGITDDVDHIEEVVRRSKDAGAQFVLCGGLTLKEGPQKERFTGELDRYCPHLESLYRQLYSAGHSAPQEYGRQVGRLTREICRRYGIPDRMPRPIIRGEELAGNKRISEALFLRAYELELDSEGASGYRAWAYRRAAWVIDELDEDLATIYERKGLKGLIGLPSIGGSIAGFIVSMLEGQTRAEDQGHVL